MSSVREIQESTLSQTIIKEDLYQKFRSLGLEYGKTFQSLEWIKTNRKEALGYFKLAKELECRRSSIRVTSLYFRWRITST